MEKILGRKKKIAIILAGFLLTGGILVGCGGEDKASSQKESEGNETTIKVGAALVPHKGILEQVKDDLKAQGVNLEIVVLDAEDQLNQALADGQIDANYFQHLPYLESVKDEKGWDFVSVGGIHIEPIGLYSDKVKSLDDFKTGKASIAVPNNASNEYRSLLLLEKNGLITVAKSASNATCTISDIEKNPYNIKFVEVDAAQLPRVLPDVTGAVINTNYVLDAGIDVSTAIIREAADSPYANIIVVRKEDQNNEAIQKLVKALQSDKIKNYLKEKYGDAVIPAF